MRLAYAAALAAVAALALAGCASTPTPEPLSSSTYVMRLSGVPSGPVAPGSMFNVSVQSSMGMGMRMHQMASDHIGAHFWNGTMMDPTSNVANGTSCVHTHGDLPGSYTAMCTAPMQPGTYHIRAHSRMMDDGTMHNWWSDEQTFTVA